MSVLWKYFFCESFSSNSLSKFADVTHHTWQQHSNSSELKSFHYVLENLKTAEDSTVRKSGTCFFGGREFTHSVRVLA